MNLTPRKKNLEEHFDYLAESRNKWIKKNEYYYKQEEVYTSFLISKGKRVLELGCGTGSLLNSLTPSYGVGVDLSEKNILIAQEDYPNLEFIHADMEDANFLSKLDGPFDYIILSDTIGHLDDCQAFFSNLHILCNSNTRLIISYFSWFWEPLLKFSEIIGLKMPTTKMSWISTEDTIGFLNLSNFESVKREWRLLIPLSLFGLGPLINNIFGSLPIIRKLSLKNYVVARPLLNNRFADLSTSIIIPCRNEKGNIENAIKRIPEFCSDIEIIFVEGGSKDKTLEEIQRVLKLYSKKDIKVLTQDGKGKGDAVRKGFEAAKGDVLMILDADLTVPPEDLPKFYEAIISGKGEYINGTRLVYPMDNEAMRFLNFWANRTFSLLFSWLLNQRLTDTLCGTKVLTKQNYLKIANNRDYFGDFDPFGDFDLIFGASKLNLKILEVPIRYSERKYGETQISRFRHGWLLLKMVVFAFRKLKII